VKNEKKRSSANKKKKTDLKNILLCKGKQYHLEPLNKKENKERSRITMKKGKKKTARDTWVFARSQVPKKKGEGRKEVGN